MRVSTSQVPRIVFAMTVFGLGVPLMLRALGVETKIWPFVAVAPLIGWYNYLQIAGKARTLAIASVVLGVGGLILWSAILASGSMPMTGRADYFYSAGILAFPVLAIGLGIAQLRKQRSIG